MYASIDAVTDRLVGRLFLFSTLFFGVVCISNGFLCVCLFVCVCIQQRKLIKYKERRMDGYHGGNRMGEDIAMADNVAAAAAAVERTTTTTTAAAASDESTLEEDYVDLEAPKVTKIKRYGYILWFVYTRTTYLIFLFLFGGVFLLFVSVLI